MPAWALWLFSEFPQFSEDCTWEWANGKKDSQPHRGQTFCFQATRLKVEWTVSVTLVVVVDRTPNPQPNAIPWYRAAPGSAPVGSSLNPLLVAKSQYSSARLDARSTHWFHYRNETETMPGVRAVWQTGLLDFPSNQILAMLIWCPRGPQPVPGLGDYLRSISALKSTKRERKTEYTYIQIKISWNPVVKTCIQANAWMWEWMPCVLHLSREWNITRIWFPSQSILLPQFLTGFFPLPFLLNGFDKLKNKLRTSVKVDTKQGSKTCFVGHCLIRLYN